MQQSNLQMAPTCESKRGQHIKLEVQQNARTVQHPAGVALKDARAQIALPAEAAVIRWQTIHQDKSVSFETEAADSSVSPHNTVESLKLRAGQPASVQLGLVNPSKVFDISYAGEKFRRDEKARENLFREIVPRKPLFEFGHVGARDCLGRCHDESALSSRSAELRHDCEVLDTFAPIALFFCRPHAPKHMHAYRM